VSRAEFEEKEYEVAFTIELASGGGLVFGSGQVLEKIVGYDAAAHPDRDHLIWALLNVPRPRGLRLVQPMWSPGEVPSPMQLPQQTARQLALAIQATGLLDGTGGETMAALERAVLPLRPHGSSARSPLSSAASSRDSSACKGFRPCILATC
jgi:hypothetical protein